MGNDINAERKSFISPEKIRLGSAYLPKDYVTSGSIIQKWQSDAVPMTVSMAGVSPDGKIILVSNSREMFEDYRIPMVRDTVQKMPGVIKSSLRDFIDPYAYLSQFAANFAGTGLKPVAKALLPSRFGKEPRAALAKLTSYFRSHAININVQMEIANSICKGMMVKYRGVKNGKEITVLAGMDYQGLEVYDALGGAQRIQNMMNPFGAFGSLFGMGAQQTPPQQQRQTNGPIPFGHAAEYGRQVDVIQWGCERSYIAVIPKDREGEGAGAFLGFVSTLMPDEKLEQEYNNLVEQMYRRRLMEAQGYAAQAQQAQINLMQSQRNLQQTLARNSAEMSAGIMDSWDKKMASDSRISANYSEAIRGVNTYTGLDGRPVEVSVVADHVYQNRYGDTFGVSGPALDPELTNRIDWTEL